MSDYSLFTSESVSEGHPDKMSDQISDAILDTYLAKDPDARVAVETLVKTGMVVVAGEVTTASDVTLANWSRQYAKPSSKSGSTRRQSASTAIHAQSSMPLVSNRLTLHWAPTKPMKPPRGQATRDSCSGTPRTKPTS